MVAAFPNIPPLDVMKEVGKSWQVITKEDLHRFQIKAAEDNARYQREYNEYLRELNSLKTQKKEA